MDVSSRIGASAVFGASALQPVLELVKSGTGALVACASYCYNAFVAADLYRIFGFAAASSRAVSPGPAGCSDGGDAAGS